MRGIVRVDRDGEHPESLDTAPELGEVNPGVGRVRPMRYRDAHPCDKPMLRRPTIVLMALRSFITSGPLTT
jgi:hypothetical protein